MRRAKPEKRELLPDIRFNSINIQTMVQHVLKQGKKSTAMRLIYDAMDLIKERTEKNPMDVFDGALKNVGPAMEVRPRRVGGATYQVPMEVSSERRTTLAIRWILAAARDRSGKDETLSGCCRRACATNRSRAGAVHPSDSSGCPNSGPTSR